MKIKKFFLCFFVMALVFNSVSVYNPAVAETTVKYTERDDFLWGINIHSKAYADYPESTVEEQIQLCAELGVKIVRFNSTISDLAYMDKVVSLCNAYDIKLLAYVGLRNKSDNLIKLQMRELAARYDGKDGRGKIDYWNLDNETDNLLLKNKYGNATPDGTKVTHYLEEDLDDWEGKFKAAIEGVRASGSDAKTVINCSWRHYGLMLAMAQRGVEFDIVGVDTYYPQFYTLLDGPDNQWGYENRGILNELVKNFDKDIWICEANCYNYPAFDSSNWEDWSYLIRFMDEAYSVEQVKAFIFYELIDEFSMHGQESTLGLVESEQRGVIGEKKAIYNKIQGDIGGSSLNMITLDSLDLSAYKGMPTTVSATKNEEVEPDPPEQEEPENPPVQEEPENPPTQEDDKNTTTQEDDKSTVEQEDSKGQSTQTKPGTSTQYKTDTEEETDNTKKEVITESEMIIKKVNDTEIRKTMPLGLIALGSGVLLLVGGAAAVFYVVWQGKRKKR